MEHYYTEQKLIQLIYGECDIFERLEMEHSLEDDLCLRGTYDDLYKTYKSLPKVKFSPRKSTLDKIINFSRGKLETATC